MKFMKSSRGSRQFCLTSYNDPRLPETYDPIGGKLLSFDFVKAQKSDHPKSGEIEGVFFEPLDATPESP